MVEPDRPQITIERMRLACWKAKATTHTHAHAHTHAQTLRMCTT
jgi:hypothetical protein